MDMLHVDIILLVILCFLTVFLCAYGVYCGYRVLVSMQMQVLLRPTRVLFSHKKEGQSREELRTVVAYQNPFTGDYCVHKSRAGPRGYLNAAQSPDSGLSDEYEPLRQPALAHSTVESDQIESGYTQRAGQPSTHACLESAYMQSLQPSYKQNVESSYKQIVESSYTQNGESAYTQRVQPSYTQNGESAYTQKLQPSYKQNVESSYKQIVESSYTLNGESAYTQKVQPSYTQNVESAYTQRLRPLYTQDVESAYKHVEPSSTQKVEPTYNHVDAAYTPAYHRREDFMMSNGGYQHLKMAKTDPPYSQEKTSLMTTMPCFQAGVESTSTQSLNAAKSPSLKFGWVSHLKSALRKPHSPLKASSMPSVEDNIIDRTWNWNYKEYQI